MGKFKSAAKGLGSFLDAWAEQKAKVDTMVDEINKRTMSTDPVTTRRIAQTLVTKAEVKWK